MNAFLPINATIRFTSPLLHPSPSHSRGKAFLCPTLKKDDIFAARNKIMCNFVPSHAEKLQKLRNRMYPIKDIAEYIVALIAAFARRFSMTETEAYQYLHRYGAISVAHEYYDVMHTQSFNDMVESMASYCRRKGGQL